MYSKPCACIVKPSVLQNGQTNSIAASYIHQLAISWAAEHFFLQLITSARKDDLRGPKNNTKFPRALRFARIPDHTSHEENGSVTQVEFLGPITGM